MPANLFGAVEPSRRRPPYPARAAGAIAPISRAFTETVIVSLAIRESGHVETTELAHDKFDGAERDVDDAPITSDVTTNVLPKTRHPRMTPR